MFSELLYAAEREFPIAFKEGLLWVEVKASGSSAPLNFLLDTGASASVIDSNVARRLGLALGSPVRVSGVKASLTGYWPVKLSAKANDVELPTEYLALDLRKLSSSCNQPVDGLIGMDFFRERIVEIDYVGGKLRILDHAPEASITDTIPFEVRTCGIRIPIEVNRTTNQWVRLDTGCAGALQWVTSKVNAKSCSNRPAVGLDKILIPETLTGVRIGGHVLDTVPTGLHRKPIFEGECGLIGNGLLAQFQVLVIDAKGGKLILSKAF